MGEVCRARDSRLDRDVAIKVLPESFLINAAAIASAARPPTRSRSEDVPARHGVEELKQRVPAKK